METIGTKIARLAILTAAVTMMVSIPTLASARAHHDPTRDTQKLVGRGAPATDNGAPEIDPSALGSVAALVAGGLAILSGRRRRA